MPLNMYVGELLELYPGATVVVTTHEKAAWVASWGPVAGLARRFPAIVAALGDRMHGVDGRDGRRRRGEALYPGMWEVRGDAGELHSAQYDGHMDYLRRTVPAERLCFFDVKDGWGPLCEILGVEVPDVPFPHENDWESIQASVKGLAVQGVVAWAFLVAGVAALAGV